MFKFCRLSYELKYCIQNICHLVLLLWRCIPEMAMLFILIWHRLRIKPLLVSGSVTRERSISSAPRFYAQKVRTALRSDAAAVPSVSATGGSCFCFSPAGIENISVESALVFGSVIRCKWGPVFTHFKVGSAAQLAARLQNSRVCVRRTGGWQKAFKRRRYMQQRGADTRRGWERGGFVAKPWRWSCATNSRMRKAYFKTCSTTTSTEVGAMASAPSRSL